MTNRKELFAECASIRGIGKGEYQLLLPKLNPQFYKLFIMWCGISHFQYFRKGETKINGIEFHTIENTAFPLPHFEAMQKFINDNINNENL